jgi:hypothetical protein
MKTSYSSSVHFFYHETTYLKKIPCIIKSNLNPYNETLEVDIRFALLVLVPVINKFSKLWYIMTCSIEKFRFLIQ